MSYVPMVECRVAILDQQNLGIKRVPFFGIKGVIREPEP